MIYILELQLCKKKKSLLEENNTIKMKTVVGWVGAKIIVDCYSYMFS